MTTQKKRTAARQAAWEALRAAERLGTKVTITLEDGTEFRGVVPTLQEDVMGVRRVIIFAFFPLADVAGVTPLYSPDEPTAQLLRTDEIVLMPQEDDDEQTWREAAVVTRP